jgi:DNA-binding PadR family transcriptional regulator
VPAAAPSPTPTGFALLGLLSFGRELSGYELKQWADDSLRFFWTAPAMSLVRQRSVVRDGTRPTKVYRLSPAGERAVRGWLAELPEPPQLKHPVALRVFLGHLVEPEDLRRAIEAHRTWCDQALAHLAQVRADLGDDPQWRNAALVADWGLDYYKGDMTAVETVGRAALEAAED